MTNDANEELRTEFNEWALSGKGESMERGHAPVGRQAIEFMHVPADARVLDVGCGSGWATRLLAQAAEKGRVTGIDISDEMIRLARESSKSFSNVDFQVASAEGLPFPNAEFTHAFSMESLYYYREILDAIGEIRRVLQPGGMFVAVIDLYQENEPTAFWVEKLPVQVHFLSVADYHTLFQRAGFVHIRDQRLKDPTPIEDEFSSNWFESRDAYLEYRDNGSLMLVGIADK
jgi:ubiquinone/menaquinone biosynthesis C-methylase UbiE